jgi:DNA modification methylase
MPESVTDRCTKSHEHLFLFSKSAKYYFDHEAMKEPIASLTQQSRRPVKNTNTERGPRDGGNSGLNALAARMLSGEATTRNRRDVWTIATQPYKEAHFATFPVKLVEPCLMAGCPEVLGGATVLDPFCGSGTVGAVAKRFYLNFIGVDLKKEYLQMALRRITAAEPT